MQTYQELGIEKWELDALVKVRDKLALNVFTHEATFWENDETARGLLFNMNYTARTRTDYLEEEDEQYECGTVCCIGGWVKVEKEGWKTNAKGILELSPEMQDSVDSYVEKDYDHPLRALYYPPDYINYDNITPAHAVQAINNFLNYGEPNWEEVFPEDED